MEQFDLGGLIWVVIIILGVAGKIFDAGNKNRRPGWPPGQPGQDPSHHRPPQVDRRGPRGAARPAPGRPAPDGGAGAEGVRGRPEKGQLKPLAEKMPIDPKETEGVSLENVKPTIHQWEGAQPATAERPGAHAIPLQEAVVWSEILGKPVALRGRRR
jgi:hypothetical protein